MSNPQKVKGDACERAIVAWLRDHRGFAAERVRSGRSTDAGDIVWPGSPWHIDAKDHRSWRMQEWVREVTAEADRDDLQPLLVVKVPRETDPGRWLAVVRLEDLEL